MENDKHATVKDFVRFVENRANDETLRGHMTWDFHPDTVRRVVRDALSAFQTARHIKRYPDRG